MSPGVTRRDLALPGVTRCAYAYRVRLLRAVVIGVLSAIAGAGAAVYAGDLGTRAHHMSDFEGGRGMFLAFIILPAGLFGGFIIGAGFGLRKGSGATHFLRQLGLALLTVAAVTGAAGGLALLDVERPPTVNGRAVELEFELKIPSTSSLPTDLESSDFTVNLHATDSDNDFATLDFKALRTEAAARVLPGVAGLNSRSIRRTLLAGPWPSQVFEIAISATPVKADFEWSPWKPPAQMADLTPLPAQGQYAVRYRVRFVE
jgi:hypothetical protein